MDTNETYKEPRLLSQDPIKHQKCSKLFLEGLEAFSGVDSDWNISETTEPFSLGRLMWAVFLTFLKWLYHIILFYPTIPP